MSQNERVPQNGPSSIGSGIMVIENAVPADLAEMLYLFCLDAMDAIGSPGKTVGGVIDHKATTDISLGSMDEWTGEWSVEALRSIGFDMPELDRRMVGAVFEVLRTYTATFTTLQEMNFSDSGYQMQRYSKGEGYYREHVDGDPRMCADRVLALVVYLNDVDEGGETYFPWQQISVRPKAGRVVVFPANWMYPHEAKVPISGDKYMISTFISLTRPQA